jgi:FkbM family methyltransferase
MISAVQHMFRNPQLQRKRRLWHMRAGRLSGLQRALPQTVCVDVGASYYPHTSWWLFLDNPKTTWIAIEPNAYNLTYVDGWPWAATIETVTQGLSKEGGKQTLYVTNVDSGSSLLKPVVHSSMSSRVTNEIEQYFLPVSETIIETITLAEVVARSPLQPILVKLDTQGSELQILESILEGDSSGYLVAVEIECSLLATPFYEGSPRLWDVARKMEQHGFEAIDIDVFPRSQSKSKLSNRPKKIVHECDAMFSLRPDVAITRSLEVRAALLGFYATNCFYDEAVRVLKNDQDLVQYLGTQGCNVESLCAELTSRSASTR